MKLIFLSLVATLSLTACGGESTKASKEKSEIAKTTTKMTDKSKNVAKISEDHTKNIDKNTQ